MTDPTPPADPTPDAPAGDPPTPGPPPAKPEPKGDQGFPENTPLAEMTVEQRENYWRAMARKHEKTVKERADYDDLKKQAAEAKKLRKERETETETQIRVAREEARAEALAEVGTRLVMARFEAAAAGRIDADRLAALTEDIDLGRFLNGDGSVDAERVATKVEAWAPPKDERRPAPKPDPTQGARNTKTSGTDVGRDMYAARRKKPASP